jgi:hypothetical protein
MASFFDMISGGAGAGLEDFLSEKQRQQIQQQSMMAMAAQLLAAGGPSTTPTSLGQAIGQSVLKGQEAGRTGVTNAAQNMLMKQKMEEYKRQTDYLKALRGQNAGASMQMPKAAPMTSGQALDPAVVPGLPIGPTNARAAQIGRSPVAPKLSDQDRRYNDLMKKYELSNQYGMVDEANKYFDQALKIKPTPKITGQPFEVTDASGKPIMVQQYDNGEIKTMAGFGPKRNVTLQNVGDRMVAVDMNQTQPGQSFAIGMTPGAAASNALAQQQFTYNQGQDAIANKLAQSKFTYDQSQDALTNTRANQQLAINAQTAANAGGGTVEERKAAMFVGRLENARKVFEKPVTGPDGKPMLGSDNKPLTIEAAFGKPGVMETMLSVAPFGENLANQVRSAGRQQYRQAQEDWVTAIMRPESGAVIGPDEMQSKIVTFFPQIGDSAEVIQQKKVAREASEKGLRLMAGRALRGGSQNTEFNWVNGQLVPVNN